jgi:hypothetical protein
MNDPALLSAVDVLILTRLLSAGSKGEKKNRIRVDLEPLLAHRWSGSVLTDVLDRAIIKLVAEGLAVHKPVKGKKAVPPLELSEEGRRTILDYFRLKQLPAKPKPTWANLKKSLLLAPALGMAGSGEALSRDDTFRAILFKKQHGLPLGDLPTLKQAKTEWMRKTLGMGAKEKVTLETVQAALLRRELGDGAPADPKKLVNRLLSRPLRARRDDTNELRQEVLRHWIDRSLGHAEPDVAPAPPPSFDLADFARRVEAAARVCPTGRYGDSKVFIVHVWRTLKDQPPFRNMDFPTFKRHLAEANNARLLDLARADLIQAMDQEDVTLSEISYMNAAFHFIRFDPDGARGS